MIKFFNVWPISFDKENLFDEQKWFLIYLLGSLPEKNDIKVHIEYQEELKNIENLKHVEIDKTEIDVARMHGKDIEKLKKERLKQEKNKRKKELNKKYGLEIEEKEEIIIKEEKPKNSLMDILQGKGLLKKDGL